MSVVKRVVPFLVSVALVAACSRDTSVTGAESAISYLYSCLQPDGGYGPPTCGSSSLKETSAALTALDRLDVPAPSGNATRSFLTGIDLAEAEPSAVDAYYRAMASVGAAPDSRQHGRLTRKQTTSGGWAGMNGVPSIEATYHAVSVLASSDMKPVSQQTAARFIVNRLYRDGHFSDVPRDSADVQDGGHIYTTFCGVQSLYELGYDIPWQSAIRSWIASCQNPDGGFSRSPERGNPSDMWYTSLAVRALRTLGSTPPDSAAAITWINSCRTADGGFGDRPGWASTVLATSDAILALDALTGDPTVAMTSQPLPVPSNRNDGEMREAILDGDLFSVYPGPIAGSAIDSSTWWPGLPAYVHSGDIATAISYLQLPEFSIGDSVVSAFLMSLRTPPISRVLADGTVCRERFEVLVPNGVETDTLEALHNVWSFIERQEEPLRWGKILANVVSPLTERGILVVVLGSIGNRTCDYLRFEPLMTGTPPSNLMVQYDEANRRDNPWMIRVLGRLPAAPTIVTGATKSPRLVWTSTGGTFADLRFALADGQTAIAVSDSTGWTMRHGGRVVAHTNNLATITRPKR